MTTLERLEAEINRQLGRLRNEPVSRPTEHYEAVIDDALHDLRGELHAADETDPDREPLSALYHWTQHLREIGERGRASLALVCETWRASDELLRDIPTTDFVERVDLTLGGLSTAIESLLPDSMLTEKSPRFVVDRDSQVGWWRGTDRQHELMPLAVNAAISAGRFPPDEAEAVARNIIRALTARPDEAELLCRFHVHPTDTGAELQWVRPNLLEEGDKPLLLPVEGERDPFSSDEELVARNHVVLYDLLDELSCEANTVGPENAPLAIECMAAVRDVALQEAAPLEIQNFTRELCQLTEDRFSIPVPPEPVVAVAEHRPREIHADRKITVEGGTYEVRYRSFAKREVTVTVMGLSDVELSTCDGPARAASAAGVFIVDETALHSPLQLRIQETVHEIPPLLPDG